MIQIGEGPFHLSERGRRQNEVSVPRGIRENLTDVDEEAGATSEIGTLVTQVIAGGIVGAALTYILIALLVDQYL